MKEKAESLKSAKSLSTSDSGSISPRAGATIDPYKGIEPAQVELLKQQIDQPTPKATLFSLFRYANAWDIGLLLIGLFFAIVTGAAQPMFTFVIGGITDNFRDFNTGVISGREFTRVVNHNCLYFVYIGVGVAVSSFIAAFMFNHVGEALTGRYRKQFLRASIRQNIGYFDHLGSGSVSTRITNDTANVQASISDTLSQIVKSLTIFITGLIIAFVRQWKLAIIGFSAVVWFFLMVMSNGAMFGKYTGISMGMYAKGSNVAEEALSAARNTIALSAQNKMAARFDNVLVAMKAKMNRASFHMSLMVCVMWSTMGLLYALITWEGSRLVKSGESTPGHIVTVMVAILIGMFNMAGIAPQIQKLTTGLAAAKNLNETLDRQPIIDAEASGTKLDNISGDIVLNHVTFRYPSRADVLVLPDFSLEIKPGHTVALVGSSGSGKSTIVGLLERFYLPLSGTITVDGVNLEELDLKWWRQQIGLVSQEPVLFANTIFENIAFGLIGTNYENSPEEKQRELVVDACKLANAWDFVQTLGEGLDTNVGERGFLLSGGQKQRIAIARAIVSNPKILLLDEATSALDTKSEGIVQEALDRAAKSRTTIVIAHRLSTIKNADNIVVMNKGVIVEQGTHHQLIANGGAYANLVELQSVAQSEGASTAVSTNAEDSFVEEDDDFVAPTIPASEPRSSSLWEIVRLVLRFNQNQKGRLLFAVIFSMFVGYAQIAYAMLLGKTLSAIMVPSQLFDQMRHTVNMTSGFFFMVGIHQLVVGFLVLFALTTSSNHLLRNVRLSLFRQMMRMNVSFFDLEKNSPGALVAILARDGKAIEGFGGSTIAQLIQCVVTVLGGAITAIAFNWRLGLVGTACLPIILGSGFIRIKILGILEKRNNTIFEKSGALATSFTNAVRTIQSLTRETQVSNEYNRLIDNQVKASFTPTLSAAAAYGLCEGMLYFILGLIWYYGSKLMSEGKISVFAYYVVFLGIVIGGNSAVMVFNYVPDLAAAKRAAGNVLRMLEAVPTIDPDSNEGVTSETTRGEITFENVHFRYPTRPQVPVLRGINLTIKPGQSVAFVGSSGCGKSTTIGLAERFYDPDMGAVYLDNTNYKDWNVMNLRSHISLVQQEPTLYSGSIIDNLLLGHPGDPSEVSRETLERCCREANVHDFIMSLPDGYETDVGGKGVLLSGGQKQRICIARALVKNPSVLLLDEATSALDAESEKVVQSALDKAAKGRTTISIAHRLSTVQNCDVIYVFDNGHITEQGTHHELLAMNGIYAELVRLQSLSQ